MHEEIFSRLAQSKFRSGFKLGEKEKIYIKQKGLETIKSHAQNFIASRIAPAQIPNDGKQTPMKGHPVFIAQHATACCCRECIYKWHHFPCGSTLNTIQQDYLINLIMAWIEKQI